MQSTSGHRPEARQTAVPWCSGQTHGLLGAVPEVRILAELSTQPRRKRRGRVSTRDGCHSRPRVPPRKEGSWRDQAPYARAETRQKPGGIPEPAPEATAPELIGGGRRRKRPTAPSGAGPKRAPPDQQCDRTRLSACGSREVGNLAGVVAGTEESPPIHGPSRAGGGLESPRAPPDRRVEKPNAAAAETTRPFASDDACEGVATEGPDESRGRVKPPRDNHAERRPKGIGETRHACPVRA